MTDSAAGQLTRIVAIRHGETAWNVDTRIQGQLDVPLNDKGLWQARRLGQDGRRGIEIIPENRVADGL